MIVSDDDETVLISPQPVHSLHRSGMATVDAMPGLWQTYQGLAVDKQDEV